MNSDLLAFIPKTYFPKAIFLSGNYKAVINLMTSKRVVFLVSKTFQKANNNLLSDLADGASIYSHSGEPTLQDVNGLEKKLGDRKFDLLIAFGGGSVIDLAKILKKNLKVKLLVIPTTIGSSSEVSQFSLVTKNNKKVIYHSDELLPDAVIFDYKLLMSVDKRLLALQGIDALAHALEALVSRLANPISDAFALSAIDEIYKALLELKKKGKSKETLEKLKIFAIMAGLAQSSAGTGLIHAFAHYFGPKNKIPHAQAVAVFFLECLNVNLNNSDRYKKLDSLKLLSSKNIVDKLTNLFKDLDVKQRIKFKGDLDEAVNQIKSDVTILTNPFAPSQEMIKDLIGKLT